MPHDITRTELVWPGKYDENGKRREVDRVSLPFQVIERVNESRATREATKARGLTLFDFWEGDTAETFEEGWRNKLIWGENKLVMSSLLEQFAGKVDLIYIDPPFLTGADFSFSVEIGDDRIDVAKEQSLIEEKAYRDTWGRGLPSYLEMLAERIELMRDLLTSQGLFFLHLGRNISAYLRPILDDVFGEEGFINEVTWKRSHAHGDTGQGARHFGRVTEALFIYSKSEAYDWHPQYAEYTDERLARDYKYTEAETGRQYRLMPVDGPGGAAKGNPYYEFLGVRGYWRYSQKTMQQLYDAGEIVLSSTGKSLSRKKYLDEALGTPVTDLWDDVNRISPTSSERLGYATQKPEALLQRVIETGSSPGALVADFFSGSGTTMAVAEKLGRRWIGADLGRFAIHTSRKRLLEIKGCKSFEVLNLGKYERKYWAVATFGEDLDDDGVISLYEYVAFILKLYSAAPAAGLQHLHGKRGRAFVHVGAVDSPVTIDEIAACIEECANLKAKELHILGWEWEMGLHDPMEDQARARGIQLLLRQIPREVMEEQAAAKGDIEFFELAYLDVAVKSTRRKQEVIAHLNNFVIPNPELVPDDVRAKIQTWSDYVDYWAVDWNFSDDTFHQGWVTYRTRQDRSLALESDPHIYESAGEYAVMVKVIDIFGNDTSKICTVTVR